MSQFVTIYWGGQACKQQVLSIVVLLIHKIHFENVQSFKGGHGTDLQKYQKQIPGSSREISKATPKSIRSARTSPAPPRTLSVSELSRVVIFFCCEYHLTNVMSTSCSQNEANSGS